MAPALGASSRRTTPLVPTSTLMLPAATGLLSAVVNAGQEISSVPFAGLPSARYSTSSITVIVGELACAHTAARTSRQQKSRLAGRRLFAIISSLRIAFRLLAPALPAFSRLL